MKNFILYILLTILVIFSTQMLLPPSNVLQRIILIGDTGEVGNPDLESGEPVLMALKNYVKKDTFITTVIFLGDNIYPRGLTDIDDPNRKENERKIDEQIAVILNSKATGYFISGNHDWDRGSDNGIEYIKRQANYINSKDVNRIKYLPKAGCPGPEFIDFSNELKILYLDTQWWFQDNKLEIANANNCDCKNEDEVITKIDSILTVSKDKTVLIAGHHPLKSYGTHGGHFNLISHIFPLTFLNDYLWLPIPIVGSLYPSARSLGISKQDLSNSTYKNFINKMESVFLKYNNIIYAAGHEHNLQVLKGINENIYLISGAGIYRDVDSQLGSGEDAIYIAAKAGFMVLDFYTDKTIKLSIVQVIDELGNFTVPFSINIAEIISNDI